MALLPNWPVADLKTTTSLSKEEAFAEYLASTKKLLDELKAQLKESLPNLKFEEHIHEVPMAFQAKEGSETGEVPGLRVVSGSDFIEFLPEGIHFSGVKARTSLKATKPLPQPYGEHLYLVADDQDATKPAWAIENIRRLEAGEPVYLKLDSDKIKEIVSSIFPETKK